MRVIVVGALGGTGAAHARGGAARRASRHEAVRSLGDETAALPFWQPVAVVVGTAFVVAALTAIPARLGGRRPVAEILRAERA